MPQPSATARKGSDKNFLDDLSDSLKRLSVKDLNDRLPLPTVSSPTMANIGAFTIAWGILERELDTAFPILFHTDPTLGACLYANLGTAAKIDILRSAVTMLSSKLGKQLTARATATLKVAADLSASARNTIAHGQVVAFGAAETEFGRWQLVRHSARAAHTITVYPGGTRYWKTQEDITLRIAQRWRTCTALIHRKMDGLTLADLRQICSTQLKEGRRNYKCPRKNPPARKGSLGGRQAMLAVWPRTPR